MAALFPSSILYIRNIKLCSPQPALELDKNTQAGTVTSMRKAFLGVIQVFSITFIVTCLILMSNGINMFPKLAILLTFSHHYLIHIFQVFFSKFSVIEKGRELFIPYL